MRHADCARSSARLLQENNNLHMGLIARSEQEDAMEKTNVLTLKKYEDEVAELTFFKEESVAKRTEDEDITAEE